MADPFLAEVRMVGFNFPPRGWATCDGELLPIWTYDAVFALIGTTYGGDGISTFALPNLRSRLPIHMGQGPGISNRVIGELSGTENETLTFNQLPGHVHTLVSASVPTVQAVGTLTTPGGNRLARASDGEKNYSSSAADGSIPLGGFTGPTGNTQAHENLPPFLTINFCIALEGIFPSRN
jgi:microcystin-dependent protein